MFSLPNITPGDRDNGNAAVSRTAKLAKRSNVGP